MSTMHHAIFDTVRRHLVRLVCLTTLSGTLAACDDGSSMPSDDAPVTETGVFGQVTTPDGAAVGGLRLSTLHGESVVTDAAGFYELRLEPGARVIAVRDPAYTHTTRAVDVTADVASRLDIVVLPLAEGVPLDAALGGVVDGARGARVELPPNALVDAAGSPVTDMVSVHLTPLDAAGPELEAAPGDFMARDGQRPVLLESFGMLDITVRDAAGNDLDVAPGQRVDIIIPATADAPDTVGLWSYDEDDAVWVREGDLTADGQGGWQGQITHFSYWNADQEVAAACISGGVVEGPQLRPVAGAQIVARGVDYHGLSYALSGPDGQWAIPVRAGSSVVLRVNHANGQGLREHIVETRDVEVPIPPAPGDNRCVRFGQWQVERHVIRSGSDTLLTCDAPRFAELADCRPLLDSLHSCLQPADGCQAVDERAVEWNNGAGVTRETADDGEVTMTYRGPDGTPCGRTVQSADTLTVTLADGRSSVHAIAVDPGSQAVTYTCAEAAAAVTLTLARDEQDRLETCHGPQGDTRDCMRLFCDVESDCRLGEACCYGFCIAEPLCPAEPTCEQDSECDTEAGELCCPATSTCTDRFECYPGTCDTDVDCDAQGQANRPCCDGLCATDRRFCEGDCQTDDHCIEDSGPDAVCCMRSGFDRTSCYTSAVACYENETCATDDDCGATRGLVCCGDDSTCKSVDACYGGNACTTDDDCDGPTTCCQDYPLTGTPVCASDYGCAYLRSCTTSAECGDDTGLVCCQGGIYANTCAPPEACP